MMHRISHRSLALTILALVIFPASWPVKANPTRDQLKQDEQALIEIEHQWAAAYVAGDADKLDSIFSPDYIQTNTRAVVTGKAEEVGDLRAGGFHYEKFETTEMKVQLYGDAAVVTGKIYLKGVQKKSGKTIEGNMRMTDTFIRQGGKWQVVASQTTAMPTS